MKYCILIVLLSFSAFSQGFPQPNGGSSSGSGSPSGLPNLVLATDATGSSSDVSALRALVALDIPTLTPTKVGLSAVTNDAQTQAAIVPNTAPSAGQLLIGNAGGTAYAPLSLSGDATLASTGAVQNIAFHFAGGASTTSLGFSNSLPFLHSFQPSGATAYPNSNLFIGYGAGNFTMAGTATQSSQNTGEGTNALHALTTGSQNSAQGYWALYSNTTGDNNSAQGYEAGLANTTGTNNSAQGYQALYSNTAGYNNSAQGYGALYSNTGSSNSAQGYQAGRYITGGSSPNQTGSYNIFYGTNSMAAANGDTNEIVIGGDATGGATGAGSNTGVFGTPRMTDFYVGGAGAAALEHSAGYVGPVTAPSGACATNGVWVFSQDGHATVCLASTWSTKI
jgi:hypothetical protein